MNFLQTPSLRKLRHTVTLLAALLGFGLLSAGPAHASGSDFHFGKYLVTLSFPNNQPLVELTTEIWYKPTNSDAYLVTSQTESLDCTVTGKLSVHNETATFSGQEYIACDQPDMVQKFYDVSQGVLNNVPYHVTARQPFAEGQLLVAGNSPNAIRPAFHHPSIQYGLVRSSATQAYQVFRVDGATSSSTDYLQSLPYSLRAELEILVSGNYKTEFTANGVSGPGSPAMLGSGLMVSLDATTIYFGYSPDTNTNFRGSIKTLTVDPGAFGRG